MVAIRAERPARSTDRAASISVSATVPAEGNEPKDGIAQTNRMAPYDAGQPSSGQPERVYTENLHSTHQRFLFPSNDRLEDTLRAFVGHHAALVYRHHLAILGAVAGQRAYGYGCLDEPGNDDGDLNGQLYAYTARTHGLPEVQRFSDSGLVPP